MKKIISLVFFILVLVNVFCLVSVTASASDLAKDQANKKDLSSLDSGNQTKLSSKEKISRINKIISDKKLKWSAGETSMSALSPEEIRSRLTLTRPKLDKSKLGSLKTTFSETSYPSTLDWRNNNGNWVTPVKNQGGCGSCWAFSSLGVIESRINIALNDTNFDIDLSEQDVVSCNGYGNCSGGNEIFVFDYAKSNGVVRESCFPYTATQQSCLNKCSNWQNESVKVLNYGVINDPTAIKQAIDNYGPVTVYMAVYDDFNYYQGGIYKWTWGRYLGLHSISIVGYNDNQGYWICKNSWGTGWGESGFFRIDYSENVLDYNIWNTLLIGEFFLDESYFVSSTDIDNDGVDDSADNCPQTYNPSQLDTDLNVTERCNRITGFCGNACDADDDNDGVNDTADACPTVKGLAEYNGCPDTFPPNITILSPLNHTWYPSNSVSVNVSAGEIAQFINASLDSSTTPIKECDNCSNLTYNLTNLTEGNHTFTVYASDYFNNTANRTAVFFVDTQYPVLISQTPGNGSVVEGSDNASFSVKYVEEHLDKIELFWNGTWPYACDNMTICPPVVLADCASGSNQTCSATLNLSSYPDGSNLTYYFVVSDLSGKNSSLQPYTVKIDRCIPNWTCIKYDICQDGNVTSCKSINDTNSCYSQTNLLSDLYQGNSSNDTYPEFNRTCKYVPYTKSENAFSTTFNQMSAINMTNETGTILEIFTTSNTTNSTVKVVKYSDNPKDNNTFGLTSLGKYVDIEIDGDAKNNLGWAIIKIYYNDDEIINAGINESSLRIYYWNETEDEWQTIEDSGVNVSENYVWANTTHFSLYGTYGQPSPYCGDGSCNNGETCSSCSSDCGSCPPPSGGGGGGSGFYAPPACTENWSCSGWSSCVEGKQTRTCNDSNKCGTTKSKPSETRSCEVAKEETKNKTIILRCVPGEGKCLGNDILECNSEGSGWSVVQTCEYGCSNSVCNEKPKVSVSPTGFITGTGATLMFGILILTAIAVVAGRFFYRARKKEIFR